MVWGYGVEKIRDNPDGGRQSAYLKAIDDLLTRGPVFVSRTVQDNTSVINLKSASRTMHSTFRLRASGVIQPSFMETGATDGFIWVLIGATDSDIERGWSQFFEWRAERIAQASRLYKEASGAERISLLQASMNMLEDAGAQEDPGLLFYEVKSALDSELRRAAELDSLQKRFRELTDSGQLVSAEQTLDEALRLGMPQLVYQQFKLEILDRRSRASALIGAGDDCFHGEQYREALEHYQEARRLDRDNPQLPTKLAMADRYHRAARGNTIRATVNVVGSSASRAIGAYFNYKREEERRKRVEAEAEAAKVKKEDSKEEKKVEQKVEIPVSTEPSPPQELPAPEETTNEKHERLINEKQQ
jgi:tetratricopeptide (TPR) repeat protein